MRLALALALTGALAVAAAAYARTARHGVPQGFDPETATAVGTRDIWVLGDYRCGARWCLALLRSTDVGRHFARAAVPSFQSQGAVPTVVFANARDGFAYVRYGTSPLYVTHDGGESWSAGPRGGVLGFAVGGGNAYVAIRRLGLERSPVSRDDWRLALRLETQYPVGLAARGADVWLVGPPRHKPDLDTVALSSNDGRTFTKRAGPCESELGGLPVPAGGGVVWAVCPTGMMAELLLSRDGGRSFPAVRSVHDPGGMGMPTLTNGAQIFPLSPRAALLDRGGGGPLLETTDTGRHWTSLRLPFKIVQLDWLGFTSRRLGLALVQTRRSPASSELWRTTDRGATWHLVPIG